jgi:hypothetical protein
VYYGCFFADIQQAGAREDCLPLEQTGKNQTSQNQLLIINQNNPQLISHLNNRTLSETKTAQTVILLLNNRRQAGQKGPKASITFKERVRIRVNHITINADIKAVRRRVQQSHENRR